MGTFTVSVLSEMISIPHSLIARLYTLSKKREENQSKEKKERREEGKKKKFAKDLFHFIFLLEDKEKVKESPTEDNKDEEVPEGKQTEDHEAREEEEKLEEASELNRKPKMRHSFNLRFRRRPKSMAAADKETEDDGEESMLSRHDPVRHSYHAGDLPVPDPSNLRKYIDTLILTPLTRVI